MLFQSLQRIKKGRKQIPGSDFPMYLRYRRDLRAKKYHELHTSALREPFRIVRYILPKIKVLIFFKEKESLILAHE